VERFGLLATTEKNAKTLLFHYPKVTSFTGNLKVLKVLRVLKVFRVLRVHQEVLKVFKVLRVLKVEVF